MVVIFQIKSYFFPLLIERKCKIRSKSKPLLPRSCLFVYKTITEQKNLMPLLRMKKTMVNSWRGLIACFPRQHSYCPELLQYFKEEETFPALVHNRERQMVWNDLRRFKVFWRIWTDLLSEPLTGHLPKPLGKFVCSERRKIPTTKDILHKKVLQPL